MRIALRCIGSCLVVAAFVSCTAKVQDLPPEEILRRAVIRSHLRGDVALSVLASFHLNGATTLSGSLISQSSLYDGGATWSANTAFDVEYFSQKKPERISGRLLSHTRGDGQLFLRFESASGELADILRTSSGSLNGWWRIGFGGTGSVVRQTAPDVVLLDAYTSAFSFDAPAVVERIDRRSFYRLSASLKPDALASFSPGNAGMENLLASGDVWISTEDFSIRRAHWLIQGLQMGQGSLSLDLDASFSDEQLRSTLKIPSGSAALLPLDTIFAIFSR